MQACAPDFEGLGEVVIASDKNGNAMFLSKYSLEFHPSSNFKNRKGRNWNTH